MKKTVRIKGKKHALECFKRGVGIKEAVQLNPLHPDAKNKIMESRELLKEAVQIARKKNMPELFSFRVSYGNSWKTEPDEDVEKAIRIYNATAKINAPKDALAQLWKVQADALLQRCNPEDIRQAQQLLKKSCNIRSGRFLAETLFSAAQVALEHPDFDKIKREKEACNYMMEAIQADNNCIEDRLEFLLIRLAKWQQLQPENQQPSQYRKELKRIYPSKAKEIDMPHAVPTDKEIEIALKMITHPAAMAYFKVSSRISSASEQDLDIFGIKERLNTGQKTQLEEHMKQQSLLANPEEAEKLLAKLSNPPADEAYPGVLAARVALIAHLTRLHRRNTSDVKTATYYALSAIQRVDDSVVRSILQSEIARIWSPSNHFDDPVCDFNLAIELLRKCVELEGGEEQAWDNTLGALAMALRNAPDNNHGANLRESRRLYQICLKQARLSGGSDVVANIQRNLAELESYMGVGSRLARFQSSIVQFKESIKTARSQYKKTEYTASLAWELTQLGSLQGDKKLLESALATFESVDHSLLEPKMREDVEGNRMVCETTLARITGGRIAVINTFRNRISTFDKDSKSYGLATAKHNLANALMFGNDVTQIQLAEGLKLSEEIIGLRTIEKDPRHRWETSQNAGRAILDLLQAKRFSVLPMSLSDAVDSACMWIQRAIEAARELGPGEELTDAAFAMCELAVGLPSIPVTIELAENAWSHIRKSAGYLLLDKNNRENEAQTAIRLAFSLAKRLSDNSYANKTPGVSFVLHGKKAKIVSKWMLRAQLPARRPLAARLSKPSTVSNKLWDNWIKELKTSDQRKIADVLDEIRELAPDFLAEDTANEKTWDWLKQHAERVAITLIPAEPVFLAMLLSVDASGERKTRILGLEVPSPPFPLNRLNDVMRDEVHGASADHNLNAIISWLGQNAIDPIVGFLGHTPKAVLWNPALDLRSVTPAAIWKNIPVATTATLSLPDLDNTPERENSTLVVLADPGPDTSDGKLDLSEHGLNALKDLTTAATTLGPVYQLGSVGKRFGTELQPKVENILTKPASAKEVLTEVVGHSVIVIVAHGEVESLEDAAILCLDESGNIDRLDVSMLSHEPDRIAGATIVLLSCEAGQIGTSFAEPGGLAGVLITAGARCVVAPLWPVQLDIAKQVGETVLNGIASGKEPWEILANLQVEDNDEGPILSNLSTSEYNSERALQRIAFVTWVG